MVVAVRVGWSRSEAISWPLFRTLSVKAAYSPTMLLVSSGVKLATLFSSL
jgi:hypothetical protein